MEGNEEEPFVYIVNFEDEEGFAIVSGDTRVPPILALVDKGHLLPDDIIDNPGVVAMLERIDTSYRLSVGLPVNGLDMYNENVLEQTRSSYSSVGPWVNYQTRGEKIACEWQQSGSPYDYVYIYIRWV